MSICNVLNMLQLISLCVSVSNIIYFGTVYYKIGVDTEWLIIILYAYIYMLTVFFGSMSSNVTWHYLWHIVEDMLFNKLSIIYVAFSILSFFHCYHFAYLYFSWHAIHVSWYATFIFCSIANVNFSFSGNTNIYSMLL